MAKPSIFSSGYEKKMRKRKRMIFISVLIVIVALVIVIISLLGNLGIRNKKNEQIKKIVNTETNSKTNTSSKKSKDKIKKSNEDASKKIDKLNFVINMPSGKQIKVIYENAGTAKVIKSVENSDPDLDYNINPSGSAIVLFQKSTQDIIVANADGTSINITNASYTATTGTVFTKDSVLKANPSYVWCTSPKFIDDTNVAYISQLPWFNKSNKYIWKFNIQDKTSVNTNLTGENVQINAITPNGLEISVDNSVQYLKGDGSVTN
ncbi:hypothetical protein SAMN02745134_02281 [Clostridium acidisoli DSM 12555]|uniref:Uncharacterized protein n=1 Tax=Clostridium acidisoli DSM 12555 TaxID=1121291 RepID=A0A1W1XL63_9CLOT|nr:hypothetical protein [Clostridium acidisoli]SMC24723.1 hypothetical protein SAMN02745134_02281 [Clostridium acidisoli DSM 12555]